MRRLKPPTEAVAKMWKEAYMKDASKFCGPTFLQPEDYHGEFTDKGGVVWKILGALEGKELTCEKIETGEVFIWDRWEVSLLKHPERHAKAIRRVEIIFPVKEKVKKKKTDEEVPQTPQLNLFDQLSEEGPTV